MNKLIKKLIIRQKQMARKRKIEQVGQRSNGFKDQFEYLVKKGLSVPVRML